jgi:hypothetical protein
LGLRPIQADGYIWSRPTATTAPKIRSGLIWAGSAVVVLLLALLVDRPTSQEQSVASQSDQSVTNTNATMSGNTPKTPTLRETVSAEQRSGPSSPPQPQFEPPFSADPRSDVSLGSLASALTGGEPRQSTSASTGIAAVGSDTSAEKPASSIIGPESAGATIAANATNEVTPSDPAAPWLTDTVEWLRSIAGNLRPEDTSPEVPATREAAVAPAPASDVGTDPLPYGAPMQPFVLRPLNGELGEYKSLADAIAFANSGDTIELHFNGPLSEQKASGPVTIDGKQLTIKAGIDEQKRPYRPLLEFVADPTVAKRSQMIRVTGSRSGLSLQGIDLAMIIAGEARSPSRQWSLFSMSETQHVRLNNVGITVRNSKAWPGVSVFDLRPPDDVTAQAYEMNGVMDEGRVQGFAVELDGCFVRGGADFITVAHTRPGRLTLRDSAFVLQSALLNVTGGIQQPLAGDALKLELVHVTTVVGDALLRLDVGPLPKYAAEIQATARDSVFSSSSAGPLVVMTGNASPTTFLDFLEWNGNNNAFDGFSEYWSI